jgi:dCMP deaminase
MERPTWDQTFISLAKEIAKRSKDTSTKVGAIIVGTDNEVRSVGYNCFPRGVNDNIEERLQRPKKYAWIEHAERNCLYNAARTGVSVKDCRIYVSWIPCADCTRGIIQSGIREIIVDDVSIPMRWRQNFIESLMMMYEANIKIRKPDSFSIYPFDLLWLQKQFIHEGVVVTIGNVVLRNDCYLELYIGPACQIIYKSIDELESILICS